MPPSPHPTASPAGAARVPRVRVVRMGAAWPRPLRHHAMAVRFRIALALLLAGPLAAPLASGAQTTTATVVEFYNAALNHYFITAAPAEATMLDAGVIVPGWQRTGVSFEAWAGSADHAASVPVCRFFGTPGVGPNSHFYTASADECALVRQNPKWTYEGIAFYIDVPTGTACAADETPVYRSFYPGAVVSQSNHRFLIDLTMHEKMAGASILEGVVMCSPLSAQQVEADAARLLAQASFGPSRSALDHVVAVGTNAFLAEQFAAPVSRFASYPYVPAGMQATFCAADPDPYCGRDYYTQFLVQNEFFRQASVGSDQLRQRVAFALSQVMVTSGLDVKPAYAMARYQQLFRDGAFGNFRDLLASVTLSPAMGDYLNMVNNDKPKGEVSPNENYARELLQLFSVGVWELNVDGTRLTDASGNPIPAYDQDIVEGFAHVFTGWTYPPLPGQAARSHNPKNYLADMAGVEANHDTAAKLLLNGVAEPAGLPMATDLANALDTVFRHPNVGPFIGSQLIQKLVTGDPTPQFVGRVAAIFNDNGHGVRGDLQAVVTAILTDPEARGPVKLDPGYGKLREPALFVAGLARALDSQTDGVYLSQQSAAQGQPLFDPPSVFNYYPPTYVVPGTASIGPEFALQNSSTAINRFNYANALAFGTIGPLGSLPGAVGTVPQWTALASVAGDTNALLDQLDALLLNHTMSAAMRSTVAAAVNAVPAADATGRAKTALYLVGSSSFFQVER